MLLVFSSKSSVLTADFFPAIELDPSKRYGLGLTGFHASNSITNVVKKENNILCYRMDKQKQWTILEIPEGAYELSDLRQYIIEHVRVQQPGLPVAFSLRPNSSTDTVTIRMNFFIYFDGDQSLGKFLGFSGTLSPGTHTGKPININPINSILIDCSITKNAYINGERAHTIYSFFPTVPVSYKITEVPKPFYLPVTCQRINNITLRVTDQDNKLLNFRDSPITIQLELKEL